MCYDDNARPPIPPGESGAARGEDIVLTGADGNRFSALLPFCGYSSILHEYKQQRYSNDDEEE